MISSFFDCVSKRIFDYVPKNFFDYVFNFIVFYKQIKLNFVSFFKEESNCDLICKIVNQKEFNEIFPNLKNGGGLQPGWVYYPQKKIVKIKNNIDFKELTIKEFFNKTNLYIPFFIKIGYMYIYIKKDNYVIIDNFWKCNIDNNFDNVTSAYFLHNEKKYFITKFIKSIKSTINLTPEILFLNYNLDVPTNEIKLYISTIDKNYLFNYNEKIEIN